MANLEFSNNIAPGIGTILRNKTTKLEWKVIGVSMPISVELMPEKIETYYGSEMIWNCLVSSISHSQNWKFPHRRIHYYADTMKNGTL